MNNQINNPKKNKTGGDLRKNFSQSTVSRESSHNDNGVVNTDETQVQGLGQGPRTGHLKNGQGIKTVATQIKLMGSGSGVPMAPVITSATVLPKGGAKEKSLFSFPQTTKN